MNIHTTGGILHTVRIGSWNVKKITKDIHEYVYTTYTIIVKKYNTRSHMSEDKIKRIPTNVTSHKDPTYDMLKSELYLILPIYL